MSYRLLGDYLYRVVSGTKHSAIERGIYRIIGVNPHGEQTWAVYPRSLLAFSTVSILFLYAFQRLQHTLSRPTGTFGPWIRPSTGGTSRLGPLLAIWFRREGYREVRLR